MVTLYEFVKKSEALMIEFFNARNSGTPWSITEDELNDKIRTLKFEFILSRADASRKTSKNRLAGALEDLADPIPQSALATNLLASTAGYLYILINPSMDGLAKIGKTTRDPSLRSRELGSSTGVPLPFILIFHVFVSDCHAAERFVHDQLEVKGCRVATNREFFRVDTTAAIGILLDAQRLFPSESR